MSVGPGSRPGLCSRRCRAAAERSALLDTAHTMCTAHLAGHAFWSCMVTPGCKEGAGHSLAPRSVVQASAHTSRCLGQGSQSAAAQGPRARTDALGHLAPSPVGTPGSSGSNNCGCPHRGPHKAGDGSRSCSAPSHGGQGCACHCCYGWRGQAACMNRQVSDQVARLGSPCQGSRPGAVLCMTQQDSML